MVIAVIAAGPIITIAQYLWSFGSFIGGFALSVLGLFVPF
jgi:hypothetical protein